MKTLNVSSCPTDFMFSAVTATKVSLKIATVFWNEHSEGQGHANDVFFFQYDC